MATLYTHTFALDGYTHVDALPYTFEDVGQLSPAEGATHATISSIAVMLYKPATQDTYNMQCRIRGLGDVWSDYSYKAVVWSGQTTQIVTFTFDNVEAEIQGLDFEIQLSKESGPAYTTYIARDGPNYLWDEDTYFVIEGAWEGVLPGKPINPTPEHTAAGITLDDTTATWESGGNTDSYIVYTGILSGMLTPLAEGVTDLSYVLRGTNWPHYGDAWYWRIDAVNENGVTTGDEWYFVTLLFRPPQISYDLISGGSEAGPYDDPPGIEGTDWSWTGGNTMLAIGRLVVAVENKIWYENL